MEKEQEQEQDEGQDEEDASKTYNRNSIGHAIQEIIVQFQ